MLEFVDNGYSGTNFNRPAIMELLDLVRDGRVNCIAVKDFSRFGRNAIEVGYYIERVFPLFRARFVSVSDGYDSAEHEGDTGGIEIAFKFLIHEQYSKDLSRKIKSAKLAKMRSGESVSKNCIYGYKLDKQRKVVIDEPATEIVRRIFAWAAQGETATMIAKRLYAERVPAVRERGSDNPRCIWSPGLIYSMLRNEQYLGTYIAGRTRVAEVGSGKLVQVPRSEWIVIPNHHPAIVEKPLFDAVQTREKAPIHSRGNGADKRTENVKHMLQDRAFCECCGRKMAFSGTENPAYRCKFTRNAEREDCHRLRISAADIEAKIVELIADQFVPTGSEIDANTSENSDDELRSLYERFLLGMISREEYLAAKASARARRNASNADVALSVRSAARAVFEEKRLSAEAVNLFVERVRVFPNHELEVKWTERVTGM